MSFTFEKLEKFIDERSKYALDHGENNEEFFRGKIHAFAEILDLLNALRKDDDALAKNVERNNSKDCINNLVDFAEHLLIAKNKAEAKKLCNFIIAEVNYIKNRWLTTNG